MGAIVGIPNTNYYLSGVVQTSYSYQYHKWNIVDPNYSTADYQLETMSLMGSYSPDLPITSGAFIGGNRVLFANPLRIIDYVSLTPPVRTATDTAAYGNLKYVICIDSSTCIAADDSTSSLRNIFMTDSNFLGPVNSFTVKTIASTAGESVTGQVALSKISRFCVCLVSKCHFQNKDGSILDTKATIASLIAIEGGSTGLEESIGFLFGTR